MGSNPIASINLMLCIGMKIAFYKGTSFVDKSILRFSRGGYSHVGTLVNDGSVIEAYPGKGVRKRDSLMDQFTTDTIAEIYEVPTTPEQDEIIQTFLESQIGKGYDYWAIAGFVFHTTHQGRIEYGRWICSELVFAAFQKAGINLLERVECWEVSPTILSYSPVLNPKQVAYFRQMRIETVNISG